MRVVEKRSNSQDLGGGFIKISQFKFLCHYWKCSKCMTTLVFTATCLKKAWHMYILYSANQILGFSRAGTTRTHSNQPQHEDILVGLLNCLKYHICKCMQMTSSQ